MQDHTGEGKKMEDSSTIDCLKKNNNNKIVHNVFLINKYIHTCIHTHIPNEHFWLKPNNNSTFLIATSCH